MQVVQDNLWLCSDCTVVACNGEHGVELYNQEATLNGLAKLGKHLVPDFDSETGGGIREFTSRICDSCGTSLAGYRARFSILGE
jgi:hypothetical protein